MRLKSHLFEPDIKLILQIHILLTETEGTKANGMQERVCQSKRRFFENNQILSWLLRRKRGEEGVKSISSKNQN